MKISSLIIFYSLIFFVSCVSSEESTVDEGYIISEEEILELPLIQISTVSPKLIQNISSGVQNISVSGQCQTDSRLDFKLNEKLIDQELCEEGLFSYEIDSRHLIEGDHQFYVEATLENITNSSESISINIDLTRPTISFHQLNDVNSSNVESYELGGHCNEISKDLVVEIDSTKYQTTCDGNEWELSNIDLSSIPDSQSLAVELSFFDESGNKALPVSSTIAKDTTLPVSALTDSFDINLANQRIYTLSGTCSENNRNVSVEIGNIKLAVNCVGQSWTSGVVDVSSLEDGNVDIKISTSDIVGNSSTPVLKSVTKDTVSSSVTISPIDSIDQSTQETVIFFGTCSNNGSNVSLNIGEGTFLLDLNCSSGNWSTNPLNLSSLSDGTFSASASHLTAPESRISFEKNTSLPTVTISSYDDINLENETSYQLSGTCSENGQDVVIDINSSAIIFTIQCTSNTWRTGFVDVSELIDGDVNIVVKHRNGSDESANQVRKSIVKSTIKPSIGLVSASSSLSHSLDLNWSVVNPGGFNIDDYVIQYRVKYSSTWLNYDDEISLNTSLVVDQLIPSTLYEFRVKLKFDNDKESRWSSIAEGKTKPDNKIFNSPFKAMNVGGATTAKVVAFYDNTEVSLNGSVITTINKGETFPFSTSQFDVIDANKPIYTAGRRGSGGDSKKANVTFSPTSWAGKNFSFNAIRSNPQNLHIYAIEDTVVEVYEGNQLQATKRIEKNSGGTLSWSKHGSYQVLSTGTVLAYHISGGGSNLVDPKPILPNSKEIIGFPSNSMRLTTSENGTNFNFWHSNSTVGSNSMDKRDSIRINPSQRGNLYTSSSLLIRSDKKVSGASFADANGSCAAPFLPTNMMKKKYMLNVQADYIAFASKQAGVVHVYSPSQEIGIDNPIQTITLSRSGSDSKAPYRARIVTNAKEGYRFISDVPIAGWYQPKNDTHGAKRDETILYGSD